MATKPGVVTTATGGATGSGVTAGGRASVGTAGKEAPKAKPEVDGLWNPNWKWRGAFGCFGGVQHESLLSSTL